MENKWIEHVKKYAAKHDISYREAMMHATASYRKAHGTKTVKKVQNVQNVKNVKKVKQLGGSESSDIEVKESDELLKAMIASSSDVTKPEPMTQVSLRNDMNTLFGRKTGGSRKLYKGGAAASPAAAKDYIDSLTKYVNKIKDVEHELIKLSTKDYSKSKFTIPDSTHDPIAIFNANISAILTTINSQITLNSVIPGNLNTAAINFLTAMHKKNLFDALIPRWKGKFGILRSLPPAKLLEVKNMTNTLTVDYETKHQLYNTTLISVFEGAWTAFDAGISGAQAGAKTARDEYIFTKFKNQIIEANTSRITSAGESLCQWKVPITAAIANYDADTAYTCSIIAAFSQAWGGKRINESRFRKNLAGIGQRDIQCLYVGCVDELIAAPCRMLSCHVSVSRQVKTDRIFVIFGTRVMTASRLAVILKTAAGLEVAGSSIKSAATSAVQLFNPRTIGRKLTNIGRAVYNTPGNIAWALGKSTKNIIADDTWPRYAGPSSGWATTGEKANMLAAAKADYNILNTATSAQSNRFTPAIFITTPDANLPSKNWGIDQPKDGIFASPPCNKDSDEVTREACGYTPMSFAKRHRIRIPQGTEIDFDAVLPGLGTASTYTATHKENSVGYTPAVSKSILNGMYNHVRGKLYKAIMLVHKKAPKQITATIFGGHGFAACLGTLGALDWELGKDVAPITGITRSRSQLYTTASYGFGNAEFVNLVRDKVLHCYNIVNDDDTMAGSFGTYIPGIIIRFSNDDVMPEMLSKLVMAYASTCEIVTSASDAVDLTSQLLEGIEVASSVVDTAKDTVTSVSDVTSGATLVVEVVKLIGGNVPLANSIIFLLETLWFYYKMMKMHSIASYVKGLADKEVKFEMGFEYKEESTDNLQQYIENTIGTGSSLPIIERATIAFTQIKNIVDLYKDSYSTGDVIRTLYDAIGVASEAALRLFEVSGAGSVIEATDALRAYAIPLTTAVKAGTLNPLATTTGSVEGMRLHATLLDKIDAFYTGVDNIINSKMTIIKESIKTFKAQIPSTSTDNKLRDLQISILNELNQNILSAWKPITDDIEEADLSASQNSAIDSDLKVITDADLTAANAAATARAAAVESAYNIGITPGGGRHKKLSGATAIKHMNKTKKVMDINRKSSRHASYRP